jgi:uncharacterized LabA/DUF88 family protein
MNEAVRIKKTAVYIDGYNLYYGRLRGTPYKWLDLPVLFDKLMTEQDPNCVIEAVKFFTAPALGKFATHGQASVEAQNDYHRALRERHPTRFTITLGAHTFERNGTPLPTFLPDRIFDRTQRTRVWLIEEKKTDVNIAMAMYRDACKGVFDQVVLCSNDSDAEPVLAALAQDFPCLEIGVVAPVQPPTAGSTHRRHAFALQQHANWTRRYLLDAELQAAQLPAVVPTSKKPIRKPAHW